MDNETKEKIIDLYKAANGRTFEAPKTSDDIEPDLPTLAELAGLYKYTEERQAREGMDEEQRLSFRENILTNGTLIDKLRLYFSSADLSGYYGVKDKLNQSEKERIIDSIQTDEERLTAEKCFNEYRVLAEYGRRLQYFFKMYQTSFSILAVLLNKWDSYDQTAERVTKMYQGLKNGGSFVDLRAFVKSVLDITNLEGATLVFDEANERFYVDVDADKRGGLYSQIKKEAKSVTEDLANFKAYVVVAEEYKEASLLQFLPTSIELSLENAVFERYTRYIVKNRAYFRSELKGKKDEGITITEEDEKRAVIPDYLEVKPSPIIYENCKQGINKL